MNGPGETAASTAARLDASAYRTLFERSPEAHLVQALDGTIVDCNEAAAALYGWTRPELLGQSYRVLVADWHEGDEAAFAAALREHGWSRWSGTARRRDGGSVAVEVVGALMTSGAEELALVHVVDVTTRIALEMTLGQLAELARLGDRPVDPDDVARRSVEILVEQLGAVAGALVSMEDDRPRWRAIVGEIPGRELLDAHLETRSLELLRATFATEAAVDLDLDERGASGRPMPAAMRDGGIRRVWLVPVLSGAEHRGAIALLFAALPPPGAFDPNRLGAIGRTVGAALQNAFLRDEMRAEIERRSTIEAAARIAQLAIDQTTDAILVLDQGGRITSFNPAAERLYGVPAAEALGQDIFTLLPATRLGSGNLARAVIQRTLESDGIWRGRVVQRATAGNRQDREVIVDSTVTALRDGAGTLTGVLVVNRDVTASARLEAELATLGSLAVATGRARTPREIADAALDILTRATSADAGLILVIDSDEYQVAAHRGLSEATTAAIASYGRLGERLTAALARPDVVVSADIEGTPIADDLQGALAADGVRHVQFVGLRMGDQLGGLLGLGWHGGTAVRPSTPVVLQAAALVASGLENARLVRRIEGGLELERSLTARLSSLIELTRLPDDAADAGTLGQYLLERSIAALGADRGIVVRVVDDRFQPLAEHRLADTFEQLRLDRPADDWHVYRRFQAGEPAFLSPIGQGLVVDRTLEAARASGSESYAAFPLRLDGRLDAVAIAFFPQPVEDLPLDDRTLEAIGRILEIAFANQRLRYEVMRSEDRYRTLFEKSPVPLVLQTLDGRVADANAAAVALFGGPREWLIGIDVAEISIIDETERARRRAVLHRTGAGSMVATGRRQDGSTFPLEVDAQRIELAGEPRALVRLQDLSERERLQQELVQAQKMEAIGLLVSGVAHELNNPLASIVAFSQLIRTDPRLPSELHQQADLLISEANRTRRIVQNLLDFARQRPPERRATALRPLVESVIALQSYTFGPGRIEAILDIPDTIPAVALDSAQFRQVLVNLTLNAAQAIRAERERGTVVIAATTTDGSAGDGAADGASGRLVRLAVTDDGPGVPEELHSRLFMPFFSTKPAGEGTGLGLSVSFGIVAAHGGSLRFEPGPGGRGSSFIIELPIEGPDGDDAEHHDRRGPGAEAAENPPPTRTARVLVLDDEASIREFLIRALERVGHEPIATGDGRVALEIVRSDPPDAILCDHRMAGMSGTEFHTAVAEIDPELATRFAFMSGDVLNPELQAFAKARGIQLLAKPFDLESIGRMIARLLHGKGQPVS